MNGAVWRIYPSGRLPRELFFRGWSFSLFIRPLNCGAFTFSCPVHWRGGGGPRCHLSQVTDSVTARHRRFRHAYSRWNNDPIQSDPTPCIPMAELHPRCAVPSPCLPTQDQDTRGSTWLGVCIRCPPSPPLRPLLSAPVYTVGTYLRAYFLTHSKCRPAQVGTPLLESASAGAGVGGFRRRRSRLVVPPTAASKCTSGVMSPNLARPLSVARIFAHPARGVDALRTALATRRRWAEQGALGVRTTTSCVGAKGLFVMIARKHGISEQHLEANGGLKCFASGFFLLNQMEPCQAPPPHTATKDSLTGPF